MEPIVTDAAEILRTIPLFAKLTPEQLAALGALAKPEHHHPLAQIVHQGDLGNRFFVITFGVVTMRRTTAGGAESAIGVLAAQGSAAAGLDPKNPPRNYFGEQMFSSQEPYDFHADAVTDVDVFRIHRKEFDELVKAQPQILKALEFIRHAERKRTHGFHWVGEGETVVMRLHKHWWAFVPALLLPLILVLLAGLSAPVLRFFSLGQYQFYPLLLAILLFTAYAILKIADWYNDEYIITNQRVTHVERNLFLQQELRDTAPIDKVQGVVIEREGFAGAALSVARLVIQTPGREQGNVEFEYVGAPEKVRAAILKQQDSNRARVSADAREQFRATVRSELRQYLAPDLPTLASPPLPPVHHRKKREGAMGNVLRILSAPFNLELHYEDRVVWRKHWVVFLGRSKRWLGLQAGTLIAFTVVSYYGGINTACLSVTLAIVLASLAPLIYEWLDWRNDIYAVTETQIIDSERAPFGLQEKTTVAPLDQITDIVVDVPNVFGTIMRYGTLKIDTAGRTGQMIFYSIHAPHLAQEEIYRRMADYKTKRAREEASIRSSSVVDAIIAYHRLQKEQERSEKEKADNSSADVPADAETEESERVWKTDEPKLGPDVVE